MDIQGVIFGSIGGLAIFLFGMKFMSDGLRTSPDTSIRSCWIRRRSPST